MTILYGRIIHVAVAGLEISEPRISVELDRQMDPTQDRGEVIIWNLRPEHEERIYERGGTITVTAGYPQTQGVIFQGEVQRVRRLRDGLARLTKIILGDRVRMKNKLGGMFNASYDGAVSMREIATDIISAMELQAGPLDIIPPRGTYTNFYSSGLATKALDKLCARLNIRWYEEDGFIRFNKTGKQQPDAPTIMVNPSNGLIGAPVVTDEGAELSVFLNPAITLGSLITLESESLEGQWKVVGIRVAADNWSGPFETFCDLRSNA